MLWELTLYAWHSRKGMYMYMYNVHACTCIFVVVSLPSSSNWKKSLPSSFPPLSLLSLPLLFLLSLHHSPSRADHQKTGTSNRYRIHSANMCNDVYTYNVYYVYVYTYISMYKNVHGNTSMCASVQGTARHVVALKTVKHKKLNCTEHIVLWFNPRFPAYWHSTWKSCHTVHVHVCVSVRALFVKSEGCVHLCSSALKSSQSCNVQLWWSLLSKDVSYPLCILWFC